MTILTRTKTKEFAVSKTGKTVITVAGIVVLELAIVYGLIPLGIYFWRLLTCPC
jgi:hypothetical protein